MFFAKVVSHMVRWYSASKKVRKIVRRLKHNSHLAFGQQPHRTHSCGDLELIRCAVEDRSNGHQPQGEHHHGQGEHQGTLPRHKDPAVMKDKIVEAKPRRARSRSKSREDKERSKSRAESSGKGSLNGSKTDLSTSKIVNGDKNRNKENNRNISPPILKSTKRRSESSPRMSRVDFSTSTMTMDKKSDAYSYRNLMKDIKNTKDIEELKAIVQHNSLESSEYV